MREARLIFPVNGTGHAGIFAEETLYNHFHGSTHHTGTGRWRNPEGHLEEETVRIIDVAYTQNTENDLILFNVAKAFSIDAVQTEVYLRYGNGYVQFVNAHSIMDNGRDTEFYSPDFAGVVDAVNQLIDDGQTPGTRVAAFEFLRVALSKGTQGNHKRVAA